MTRHGKRMITFNGETRSVAEWAKAVGITENALRKRLARMSPQQALKMKGKECV